MLSVSILGFQITPHSVTYNLRLTYTLIKCVIIANEQMSIQAEVYRQLPWTIKISVVLLQKLHTWLILGIKDQPSNNFIYRASRPGHALKHPLVRNTQVPTLRDDISVWDASVFLFLCMWTCSELNILNLYHCFFITYIQYLRVLS